MRLLNAEKFTSLCARINASVSVRTIIELVDYRTDKAVKDRGLWRMFCPVHEDPIFRTLVINPRRNTYHCEHSGCPAHQPADLIDLVARSRDLSREGAVGLIVRTVGHQPLRLTGEQYEKLMEYIRAAEISER